MVIILIFHVFVVIMKMEQFWLSVHDDGNVTGQYLQIIFK